MRVRYCTVGSSNNTIPTPSVTLATAHHHTKTSGQIVKKKDKKHIIRPDRTAHATKLHNHILTETSHSQDRNPPPHTKSYLPTHQTHPTLATQHHHTPLPRPTDVAAHSTTHARPSGRDTSSSLRAERKTETTGYLWPAAQRH